VSVLVPVLNEERHIREAVAAMRRQRFDGAIEFLYADGRSSDRTKEILEELAREDPRIRVFDNPLRHTAAGLNICLRHARGEFVARMDAHSLYPDDYLARGVARLREGGTQWVSGPQVPDPQGRVSAAAARALGTWLGQGGSRKWASGSGDGEGGEFELDTGVFTGVWKRQVVLDSGGWDEGWPRNQDAEMAARFLAAGERLVCVPAMGARYIPRNTLKGLYRQYHGYGYFRVRTALRHPHSLRRSSLLPPAVVCAAAAAVAAPRPLRGVARAGVGAYVAALVAAGASCLSDAPPEEAALVPAALAAMHLGNGVGVLQGMRAFGVPWAALANVAGLSGLAERLPVASQDVNAPSLAA